MNHREYEALADIFEHAATVFHRLAVSAPSAPGLEAVPDSAAIAGRTNGWPLLLTVSEAAEKLKIGRASMYALVASREVPSITIGRSRRIPLRQLESWVEQRTRST